ncbi:VOC family protein [Pimelobacter simplex]|uniref:VOC family protein n=1 Tax=Nocardioides simplex TaxID=2045 RepID=UPI003AACF365
MSHPRLRQVVLITADLDAALTRARDVLGFGPGVRDVEEMAKLGFEHEVLTLADTFVEVVAPLDPESSFGQLVRRNGDGGYMAVVQVGDLQGVVDTAAGIGVTPVIHQDYDGHRISQWHPKHLGTLAELDQVEPADTWHFAPGIFENKAQGPGGDIVACTIATPDPQQVAGNWATMLGIEVGEDAVLRLPGEELRFVASGEGPRGLVAVDLVALDPARAGETIELCGVRFTLVTRQGENA